MSFDAQALLNQLPTMVGYWDRSYLCQYANPAYASWLGTTPAQMIGRHAREVLGEAAYHVELPFLDAALRGESMQDERTVPASATHAERSFRMEWKPDAAGSAVRGVCVHGSEVAPEHSTPVEVDGTTRYVKAILDNLFAYVALLDTQGVVLEVNRAPLERAGLSRENVIGQYFYDAPWWSYQAEIRERIRNSIEQAAQGKTIRFDIAASMGDDRQTLDFMISPVRDEHDRVIALIPTAVDVTYRKKVEADLRIAATAFDSKSGILVTDANGKILRANTAFLESLGYTHEEIVGKNPRMFKADRHDADFYSAMWRSIVELGSWEGEIWDRCKDGRHIYNWINITAITDDDGTVTNYVSTQADITDRKIAEDAIQRLAFYDPLTDLPNRRLLADRLQQAQASYARTGKEGAILFIDLDNFKALNDTQGHDVGDILLVQVAKRLRACVREGDTVARLGGDEYIVMLEDLSEDQVEAASQAKVVGKKILDALNQPYQLVGHEYRNTPSIGVTLLNGQHHSADDLLKQADIAMYQAKKSGRNTLRFFDPRMQEAVNVQVSMEKDLQTAVEHGAFQLHYQVQIDATGKVIGAEALIRWVHPTRGIVSPADFIPLAEETGLILPLGAWVIEAACAQLKAWQGRELLKDLVLAVNVSAKQMKDDDFVNQVKHIVGKYAISPKLLKLELTESMLVDNVKETIEKIESLRNFGLQFSLDDFGTGYSSLQYLKKIPLDQLKIDQSFVRGLEVDHHDRSIVRTVIAIAQSLELDAIAEGVETVGQLEILKAEGCKFYQGYLLGKPMTVDQFESLL